jgi:flagellar biogenesis protein FliO
MKFWRSKTRRAPLRCWIAVLFALTATALPAPGAQKFEADSGGSETAGSAVSAEYAEPQAEGGPATPAGGWNWIPGSETGGLWPAIRSAGATIFVIALILSGAVLLKGYMPHRFGPLRHTKRIHVLESVTIGEKRTLTLVEVDRSTLLLASSPAAISLIKEFGRPGDTAVLASSSDVDDRLIVSETRIKAPFKQALISELAAAEGPRDPRKILARLSQIRQGLEAR